MSCRVAWSRPEPFGAWVRLDDATLLAVDAPLAERLGVAHGLSGAASPVRPLELHLAVTARCGLGCDGCYLDAQAAGGEPSAQELEARLRQARASGASTVAFGGGEPLLRRDLGRLATLARALDLVPVVTTSGFGLTAERARELGDFAQINVSYEGAGGARGPGGREVAERAIALLRAAGIAVGVNVVLTRASFEHVTATAARAAELGARELQLLRYKPAGRAAGPGYFERRLETEQVGRLWGVITGIVEAKRMSVRIDCAMVPLLADSLLALGDGAKGALDALGVFGCEAGRLLGAVRADGHVSACSFCAPPEGAAEPLPAAWESDVELARVRAHHAAPVAPCRACALYEVCRGGCQVVSRHGSAEAAFGPDPECPLVRAHSTGV